MPESTSSSRTVDFALVGDFRADVTTLQAIPEALTLAVDPSGHPVELFEPWD